jgi:hydrogenase maturation protein HypF
VNAAGVRIEIRGTVQGVGFRPWVHRVATSLGVAGRIWNDGGGVTIDAFGAPATLDVFLAELRSSPPPAARIASMHVASRPWEPTDGFAIVASAAGGERRVSIPADLATCVDCLRELFDPNDRRFRYPFINCTNCGPRFTIALDVPYDRPATTMAPFRQCRACQREYDDPVDRRFHAQPNACPECGPRLRLVNAEAATVPCADPLAEAARVLRAGGIVALKGIGGYHLACDATQAEAVRLLRKRKNRDAKPFAVMVRSLPAARLLSDLSPVEERLLLSVERPIALLRKRRGASLVEEVAPNNPLVGVMLPYAPLHHLLLADLDRPLVMTSGNVSDEPIAYLDEDAARRLSPLADLVVAHDRKIVSRCDDSVARVVAGAPVVLRRSRGWTPRAVPLDRPVSEPVLGCGAQLKNTFCLAAGDSAFLGPHIGDLDHLEIYEAYEEAIDRLERFVGVRPEVVAYDLHPEYLSTSYALQRSARVRLPVQHHHAHVAAAMAEHHLDGPILGLAWDGTGFGTDGTSWGGELLLAHFAGFERLATFRPLPLAGGDKAIRQVWRAAAALLDDAFEGKPPIERLPLFHHVAPNELEIVRDMARRGIQAPLARGIGRYFDAVGALVLGLHQARYEGEVAVAWNVAADPSQRGTYPWDIDRSDATAVVDPRPMVRAIVHDLLRGETASTISARFHDTLAEIATSCVRETVARAARRAVVLTGGCFQNPRLTEAIVASLAPDVEVLLHNDVPPGDGGIALGQVSIANARDRRVLS